MPKFKTFEEYAELLLKSMVANMKSMGVGGCAVTLLCIQMAIWQIFKGERISIGDLVDHLNQASDVLLGMHALTGCDTVHSLESQKQSIQHQKVYA